jgi:hypothetical protein
LETIASDHHLFDAGNGSDPQLTERPQMINLPIIFDEAVRLFHSPNIAELMGQEEPFDLQEATAIVGIDPSDLALLAPEEVINLLQEKGIDPDGLSGGPVLEQLQAVARK